METLQSNLQTIPAAAASSRYHHQVWNIVSQICFPNYSRRGEKRWESLRFPWTKPVAWPWPGGKLSRYCSQVRAALIAQSTRYGARPRLLRETALQRKLGPRPGCVTRALGVRSRANFETPTLCAVPPALQRKLGPRRGSVARAPNAQGDGIALRRPCAKQYNGANTFIYLVPGMCFALLLLLHHEAIKVPGII